MKAIIPLILLASVLAAFTATFTLGNFAFSGDEYSYTFQAKILSSGKLYASPPPLAEAFTLHHVINDGKWYGRYTLGWPAILALSLKASWLLKAAISGAATLFTFFLASRLFNRKTAIIASTIMATSPFFVFNAASFYPHAASLLFSGVFALFFLKCLNKNSKTLQLIAGSGLGAVFLIRPIDAAIIVLPLAAYSITTVRNAKLLAKRLWLAATIAAALAGIQLAANHILSGSILTFPYGTYDPTENFALKAVSISHLFYRLGLLALWMPLSALALFARKQKATLLLSSIIATNILTYLAFPYTGGDQFGPRYYFPSVLTLAILAGSALSRIQAKHAIMAILLVNLPLLAFLSFDIHKEVSFRQQVYEETGHLEDALILIESSREQGCEWYTRNSPALTGNIFACNTKNNDELISAFPNKIPHNYDLARMGKPTSLYSRLIRYS